MFRHPFVCLTTGFLAAFAALSLGLIQFVPSPVAQAAPAAPVVVADGGALAERGSAPDGLDSPEAPDGLAAPNPAAKGPRAVTLITLTYMYGTSNAVKNISVFYPTSGPPSPVAIILPMGEPRESDPANNFGQAQHLASWGWVVAVPGAMWSEDTGAQRDNVPFVSRVLDTVLGASQLAGKTTDRAAVVGTWWNGITARMAAGADSRFKAVVSLHAGTFGPNPGNYGPDTFAPYLALGGIAEGDFTVCPVASTWSELYRVSRMTHRARFEFGDARPGDFMEPSYAADFFNFCGAPRATPFAWIKGLMTAWLEYYVKGDASQFDNLYKTGGDSTMPAEVTSSAAANAPLGFKATPSGETSVHLTWTAWITDTTVLDGLKLERTASTGEVKDMAKLALNTTAFDDTSLMPETSYTFTLRYVDKGGHLFQPASVNAGKGIPTPTATPSPRPTPTITRTPTSTHTPSPSRTPTPTRTATSVPVRHTIRLPWAGKNADQ